LLNYIGNYDYYLEKKEEVERAYLSNSNFSLNSTITNNIRGIDIIQGNLTNTKASAPVPTATEESEGKLDWKQQKEEQARIRKRQNELKKTEDEIHQLETRNEEIDELLTREEVYTNVSKLMELNKEKKEIENRLEELLVLWEELAD